MNNFDIDQIHIADLGVEYFFVQSLDEIKGFNSDYDQDYAYYFLEYIDGLPRKLLGSYSAKVYDRAYYVATL